VTPRLAHRLDAARRAAQAALLAQRGPEGHWTGHLSSSALSTATAVTALAAIDPEAHAPLIRRGLDWLATHANGDGGWGDTVESRSNLSTTALAWAAFGIARADLGYPGVLAAAEAFLRQHAGSLEELVPAIEALYGDDRTFSVPITMMLALSGRLGPDGWRRVRPLPFELAALPRGLFGALRLPVVSYALPALIAIGQVIHQRSGRTNPLRALTRSRTLSVLARLQPENGGFLEATPLTSFVTMSLAGLGLRDHQVARRGVSFLKASVRADGSWPIDTNLATWVTTLSIKALSVPGSGEPILPPEARGRLREWLLGQQYRTVHPYTGAAPGGWAWTDLPGGVPDADDTAGALLALATLAGEPDAAAIEAATAGTRWLLGVQNRDGGIPTFCRGWGTLPFDRSTPELTAHALRAWKAWIHRLPKPLATEVQRAAHRAVVHLGRTQRADGAWIPLWFGNEAAPAQENPVYGTAQVLIGLGSLSAGGVAVQGLVERGEAFLKAVQHPEGGWGGDAGVAPTVEETALALRALGPDARHDASTERGLGWLLDRWERGKVIGHPSPIGLYFARLWYHEALYPLIFTVDALNRFHQGTR
jgi:squalene-hopene/tetraprenyl-beta-curcumene cyclase